MSKVVAACLVAVMFHTPIQWQAWLDDWTAQADQAVTAELLAEAAAMRRRHPCYVQICTTTTTRTSARPESASAVDRGMGADVEQWRPLVASYFGENTDKALQVMRCESGGNPTSKNPNSSASGLFQHLARYWPDRSAKAGWAGADIFDPEANIAVAAWLSQGGIDWSHWTCA